MRAYRQGLAAGDYALAGRAAQVLMDGEGAPPDVSVLEFTLALRAGDRVRTDRALVRMAAGPLDFLAAVLGAWVAFERGEDPTPLIEVGRKNPLARRYAAAHAALLLIAQGRPREGRAALAPLLGFAVDNQDLRIDAAQLFATMGERSQSRALLAGEGPQMSALRKRLRPAPLGAAFGASRLFLGLASELAQEDTLALSILLTRAALLLDPGDDRSRLYLAEALSQAGSEVLALEVLGEVRRDSPFARGAAAGTVMVLRRAGRSGEALARAKALAEAEGATSADAREYGDLLAAEGRFEAAAAAYGRALGRLGDDEAWRLHLLRGEALDRAGHWPEALAALREAAARAPREAAVLNRLGYAQVARGENLAEAQALLERAARLHPKDADIGNSLAWAYYRSGEVARALPLLERGVQSDPGGSEVNEHLGDAYWRLGRRYEARYAWKAAALQADNEAARRIEAKLAGGLAAAN